MYKVVVFESAKELLNAAATNRDAACESPPLPSDVLVHLDLDADTVALRDSKNNKLKHFDVSILTPQDILKAYGERVELPICVTYAAK